MSTIRVSVVSAEREIYSGDAQAVFAPAANGDVGILPHHAPLLALLRAGEVVVRTQEGTDEAFYVNGGVLEVQPSLVTILSDTVARAHDLDEAAVLAAKERAERLMRERSADLDYARAQAELAEAVAQLATIQRLRRRAGR
jgi:F-type H+-transporting ATPase subunit epsilon